MDLGMAVDGLRSRNESIVTSDQVRDASYRT